MSKRKKLNLFLIAMLIVGISTVSAGCIGSRSESPTEAYDATSKLSPDGALSGKVGEPVKVKVEDYKGTKVIEVTVLEYIRGERANRMINDTNRFNDKPKAGYEYLLVKVRVQYIKGSEELRVSPLYFMVFSKSVGRKYSWIVMPEDTPKFEPAEMLPGAQVEGWIAFEVAENREAQFEYYPRLLGDPAVSIKIPAD